MGINKCTGFITVLIFVVVSLNLGAQNFVSDLSTRDSVDRKEFIKTTILQLEETEPIEISKVYDLLKSCLNLKDTMNFLYITKLIGNRHYPRRGLNEEGIIFLKESQRILGVKETKIFDLNNSIGNHFSQLGFLLEAQEFYFKSLEWHEKYDKANTTTPLGNIANVYFRQANYKKALQYNLLALKGSLKLTDQKSRRYNIIFDYFRLAIIHEKLGHYEKAKLYYSKSIEVAKELGDKDLLLTSLTHSIRSKYSTRNKTHTNELIAEGDKLINKKDTILSTREEDFLFEKNIFYLNNGLVNKAMTPDEMRLRKISDSPDKLNYLSKFYTATNNVDSVAFYYSAILKSKDQKAIETRKNALSNIEEKYVNRNLKKNNEKFKKAAENSKWIIRIIMLFLVMVSCLLALQYLNNKKHRFNNQLLNHKSTQLAKSNKELAESNEELERFVFVASHDLKTPIVNIMNFSNLLESRADVLKDEKMNKYIGFIKSAGNRLNNIVLSSLEFSKFSKVSETIEKEKIDLNFLLKEIEGSMTTFLTDRNARIIRVNKLGFIHGSYPSIFILLQNIIDNGIRYNKSDIPTIYLESKENIDSLSIFIKDNGIGIDNDNVDKIFTMFTRLHNHSEYAGSGLGLSIGKKIIEKLDGEIRVESALGEGTTFELIIPFKSIPTIERKFDVGEERPEELMDV